MQCFEIREKNSSNFYIKLLKLKLLQGKTKVCFTREFFFWEPRKPSDVTVKIVKSRKKYTLIFYL